MIQTILHIIFLILFVYLSINTLYFFVIAVAGKMYRAPKYGVNEKKKRIAILIPSYKEDYIIVNTARKAAEHDYPKDKFDVFVAADQLQRDTIEKLRAIPVNVLEVQFEIGSKARSLNKLLNHIPEDNYDVAFVLDADNVMMPGTLEKVNDAFQQGFRCVQAHRTAKNLNTPVAVLDAMSEEINNHLFRRAQRALGFSCCGIGSGLSFEFKKLKELYNRPSILGNHGEDREVDFILIKEKICTEFIDDALVLDEKVSSRDVYELQRTRWLEAQMAHLRMFFDKKGGHIPKTKDYWNRLFVNAAPPRLIFLFSYFLVFALFLVEYFTGYSILLPSYGWWFGLTLLYLSVFIISIPGSFFNWSTVKAVMHVPALVFSMVRVLFKMKVSRKEFLHTPKTFTQDS